MSRYDTVLSVVTTACEQASSDGLHGYAIQAHAIMAAYDALKAYDAAAATSAVPVAPVEEIPEPVPEPTPEPEVIVADGETP